MPGTASEISEEQLAELSPMLSDTNELKFMLFNSQWQLEKSEHGCYRVPIDTDLFKGTALTVTHR